MFYNLLYYYYKNIIISRFFEKFFFFIYQDIPLLNFIKIQFNFITMSLFNNKLNKNYIINLFFFLEELISLKSISLKKKVNYTINLKSTIILYQYKIMVNIINNLLYNFLLYLILVIFPLSQKINIKKLLKNVFNKGILLRILTFSKLPSFSEKSTDLFNDLIINIITTSKNIYITKYFFQNFNLTSKNLKKKK